MTYNSVLAGRVRHSLEDVSGIVEKVQFGGIGFLLNGNMLCGVIGSDLVVRVGPAGYEAALSKPHTRPFDYIGKPMQGWVYVEPAGCQLPEELQTWVQLGLNFTASLPPR